MASAGKINIKNVLDSLCKILEFAGCGQQLVPEDFRLAKLDRPDVVDKLWQLLCDLVAFLSRHNNQEMGDGEPDRPSGSGGSLEFVRKELAKYGYSNSQFYRASSSSSTSSRLLLVTIGWLLSSQDMLELFLLDMQTYDQILEANWSNFASGLDADREKQLILSKYKCSDPIDQLNHLKYLQLNTKQVVNGLYSARTEKAHLTSKLRAMTKDDLVLSDPVNELLPVAITRRPLGTLYKYQQQIERENEFYKAYLAFAANEQLFWEWMETVVDEQMAAAKSAENDDDRTELLDANAFSYSSQDLKRLEFYQNVFQKNVATLSQYLDIVNEHAKLGGRNVAMAFAPSNQELDQEVNSIFQSTLVNSTYFYLNRFYDNDSNSSNNDKLMMSTSSFLYSKKFVDAITNSKYSSNENRLFLRQQIRLLQSYLRVHGLLNDSLKKSILGQLNKYLALIQKSGVVPIQINSSKLALC